MPVLLTTLWRRLVQDPQGTRAALTLPSLVWEAPAVDSSEASVWQMTKPGSPRARPGVGEALVFTVEKSAAGHNPFPMGVTIGRVETNDVVLVDTSVSRFHAWLQADERTHGWTVTDAESRNGTWVNGLRCEARRKVPLPDLAQLRVGDAALRFLLPQSLLAFLEERGENAGA